MLPSLSVIIAAHNSKRELLSCLSALKEQQSINKLSKYEIIVVGYLSDETKRCIEQKYPLVKTLQTTSHLSVPALRSLGIKASEGDILSLLEDHCVPANNWIQSILTNHHMGHPVVGGAVENSCTKRIADWAVYFFEYSAFMNPIPKGETILLPGNNISYKRCVIQYFNDLLEQNLWEHHWHERLAQKDIPMISTPDMIVYHNRSFRIMRFWHISFLHGYNYASAGSRLSRFRQMSWIMFLVFVPFILTLRVGQRIFKKQRHIKKFIISSPIILWFYIGWTIGEVIGTFSGRTINNTGWGE